MASGLATALQSSWKTRHCHSLTLYAQAHARFQDARSCLKDQMLISRGRICIYCQSYVLYDLSSHMLDRWIPYVGSYCIPM
jgi:hypothetical protein